MKKFSVGAFALAAVIATTAASAQGSPAATDSQQIVVDFVDGTSRDVIDQAARAEGITLTPNSFMGDADGIMLADVDRAREQEILSHLRARSDVQSADENGEMHAFYAPNDPDLGSKQWHMERVGAPSAWNSTCGQGVIVAVVDTGVACENHGNFTRIKDLEGTHCLTGYDFIAKREHANDDQGHGTHVAGTIAQTTNNGFGGAGIAYCATILPVKVLNHAGSGSFVGVAEGIRYAADQGARVINLSLGGGGGKNIPVVGDAVAYARSKGVLVVAAAGNSGRAVESPGREAGAIAVSAIDPADNIATFSSRGPQVFIGAPGVAVYQQTICKNGRDRCEEFAAWSGTSMAAPHVAGVAALAFAMGVTRVDAVEELLRETASTPKHGDTNKELYGAGIVSAQRLVAKIASRQISYRAIAALAMLLLVAGWIRSRKGEIASAKIWLLPAVATSVGLFFLPWILPHVFPGVDLLMRPVGDWTLLVGQRMHRWLLLASFPAIAALVSVGFGNRSMRAMVGGAALGTAAYLGATVMLGYHDFPLGRTLGNLWCIGNGLACFWIARIGLDTKTG